MQGYQLLIDYFISLAEEFLEHTENEPHFFRSHQELVNFPALSLENYKGSLSDNGGDGRYQHRTLSFLIVDHLHDTGDDSKIDEIYDNTELLGLQIINQMFRDGRDRQDSVIVDFDLNTVNWFPVVSKDHYYGQKFSFSLLVPHIVSGL